jgi:hypothetical protein
MEFSQAHSTTTPRSIRRGPYRTKKRTPRQTKHYRNRRRIIDNAGETTTNSYVADSNLPDLHVCNDDQPAEHTVIEDTGSSLIVNTDESDHQNDNDESINTHVSSKLYADCKVTEKSSELAITSYISKYHLTLKAQDDLLRLLQLHIPLNTSIPSSVYSFRKISSLNPHRIRMIFNYFCPRCFIHLPDENIEICINKSCEISFEKLSLPYFITLPIAEQLRNLLRRPNLYMSMLQTKNRPCQAGKITDISDGLLYQSILLNNGLLPNAISLTMNTDGVAVYKSTKHSIWPVLFIVNELPFSERRQAKNMVLGGLWYSEEKPHMQLFLKPIVEELAKLETTG